MHHRRISRDRPSDDVVGIVQVDNDDIVLVSNADERVGLESEGLEGDGSGLDAERCELFSQRAWLEGVGSGGARGVERERGGRIKRRDRRGTTELMGRAFEVDCIQADRARSNASDEEKRGCREEGKYEMKKGKGGSRRREASVSH